MNGLSRPYATELAQLAAVLILEPIFEGDLQTEQHAYRAKHSAQEAVKEIHGWLEKGLREVVDADLSGYWVNDRRRRSRGRPSRERVRCAGVIQGLMRPPQISLEEILALEPACLRMTVPEAYRKRPYERPLVRGNL